MDIFWLTSLLNIGFATIDKHVISSKRRHKDKNILVGVFNIRDRMGILIVLLYLLFSTLQRVGFVHSNLIN